MHSKMIRSSARLASLRSAVPSHTNTVEHGEISGHLAKVVEEKSVAMEENDQHVWNMISVNVKQDEDNVVDAIDAVVSQSSSLSVPDDDCDSIASSRPTSPRPTSNGIAVYETQLPSSDVFPSQALPLTESELFHAKVLVLDLLGWGVPPEYIISRGVSKQLIASIFLDLKLKLPESLTS